MVRDYKSYGILEGEINNKSTEGLEDFIIKVGEKNSSYHNKDKSETGWTGDQDTSFIDYVKEQRLKKYSGLKKWGIYFMAFLLFVMLLPFISIVLIGSGMVIGFTIIGILICIGGGIYILGGTCFMATQLSFSMVILGLTVSVAFLSLGGIVVILAYLFIKWISRVLKQSRLKKIAFYKGEILR